eukprot:CAMPEP_0172513998 /NCGR_PEP_ID=MMETSP1066-20121228/257014_1 /TAXON_ID=671091 /ORGANISM="Coscinodiscus wailesii, Strain CCMP2513" /LENGTH=571 /DNA_ID=CAMNT_0013294499 /DNA_START=254 /DNA_END=1967 /DNA_ORIENTATION=+
MVITAASNHRNLHPLRPTRTITHFHISTEPPQNNPSIKNTNDSDTIITKSPPHKQRNYDPSFKMNDNNYDEKLEEARLRVLSSRRSQVRQTLKFAESTRTYRLENDLVPPDDDDEASAESTKSALALTAGIVAVGALTLRIGGRAALVSGLGLDFAKDNPELKGSLDSVLEYTNGMDIGVEAGLFVLAWTFVKVFCFDAGGVILALSAGVLFGGVFKGAAMSAFAATVGSTVAFGLAKVDSPVRKKALELLEEYPSLRGIEKVVARDGVKAVLTLRLAPVLPIPIGLYNYIYGVTNVPLFDFMAGIFFGSFKPYLLDSYLGYFGKELLDGGGGDETQDFVLLVALGVSVLVGVFASQLAGETWDAIQKEADIEKEKMKDGNDDGDGVVRNFMGVDLPQWVVGFQLGLKGAEKRLTEVVEAEYNAKVWNYTKQEEIPKQLDPALSSQSPEILGKGQGLDFTQSFFDGLVLSPVLLSSYLKYADPAVLEETKSNDEQNKVNSDNEQTNLQQTSLVGKNDVGSSEDGTIKQPEKVTITNINNIDDKFLLNTLSVLRVTTTERLEEIEKKLETKE